MHPRVLAQKDSIATDRMVQLAPRVAGRFGVAESVSTAYDRQPDIRQMLRNQAVADLLEALANTEMAKPEMTIDVSAVMERLEGAEGIGPKTLDVVRKALERK